MFEIVQVASGLVLRLGVSASRTKLEATELEYSNQFPNSLVYIGSTHIIPRPKTDANLVLRCVLIFKPHSSMIGSIRTYMSVAELETPDK